MVQDRYYLTKNTENLLQSWYDSGKIIEVNEEIEQVIKCIHQMRIEWNDMQRKLYEIVINEL